MVVAFRPQSIQTIKNKKNFGTQTSKPVFPISAKKCEIFSGIFVQIFYKYETALKSSIFHFEKLEMAFNFCIFFCGDAMSGTVR